MKRRNVRPAPARAAAVRSADNPQGDAAAHRLTTGAATSLEGGQPPFPCKRGQPWARTDPFCWEMGAAPYSCHHICLMRDATSMVPDSADTSSILASTFEP